MASVLKSVSVDSPSPSVANAGSGLAGFNLDDLAQIGQVRLKECQRQVAQMLETARQDAVQIRQSAHDEGYQEGLQKAALDADTKLKSEADRRAKDGLQLIQNAVSEMRVSYGQWMSRYSELLSGIALAAAEKVTRRKLEQESDLLVTWATEAVMSTRSATRISVAVHPETLVELGEKLDELLASPDLPEQTQVVPDASLRRSDVVVRQTGGEIQAGLDAQIERLCELLK